MIDFESNLIRLLLGLFLVGSASSGMAALGKAPETHPAISSESSVPGARVLAVVPVRQLSHYIVHEVQLESGGIVREFATTAGTVFAISWRGPVLPDLNVLLGSYFSTFLAETEQARVAGRRGAPVNMERGGVIIRSTGRMRNFSGHAYVPALIPTGVDINELLQ